MKKKMIFGVHAVTEAIRVGEKIDKILIRLDLEGNLLRTIFEEAKTTRIPIRLVPREKLDQLTRKKHQGVIAFISAIHYSKLEDMIPFLYESGKNPIILLLDGVTDVRNFGAIARTCLCTGVDTLVIPKFGSVSVSADAIKASAGALMALPICREKTISGAINLLKTCGYQVYAATEKATVSYIQADYISPTAIVFGNEEKGISSSVLELCNQMLRIPILGNIASLNISVAAAIFLYEIVRQRLEKK